jgi:hypothetical protein
LRREPAFDCWCIFESTSSHILLSKTRATDRANLGKGEVSPNAPSEIPEVLDEVLLRGTKGSVTFPVAGDKGRPGTLRAINQRKAFS